MPTYKMVWDPVTKKYKRVEAPDVQDMRTQPRPQIPAPTNPANTYVGNISAPYTNPNSGLTAAGAAGDVANSPSVMAQTGGPNFMQQNTGQTPAGYLTQYTQAQYDAMPQALRDFLSRVRDPRYQNTPENAAANSANNNAGWNAWNPYGGAGAATPSAWAAANPTTFQSVNAGSATGPAGSAPSNPGSTPSNPGMPGMDDNPIPPMGQPFPKTGNEGGVPTIGLPKVPNPVGKTDLGPQYQFGKSPTTQPYRLNPNRFPRIGG